MPASVKHKFVNPIPDDPSFAGVKPSNWNAEHVVILGFPDPPVGDGRYVLNVTGGIVTWELVSVQAGGLTIDGQNLTIDGQNLTIDGA